MGASTIDGQLKRDQRVLGKQPKLLQRKWQRMSASPFSFLRGAATLWAELMTEHDATLQSLPGAGIVVGDLHLENFGTLMGPKGLTIHVNDFDETFIGPWASDVLRLLTSVLLARPELGVSGTAVVSLAEAVLTGHQRGIAGQKVTMPESFERLLDPPTAPKALKWLNKKLTPAGDALLEVEDKTVAVTKAVAKDVPAALSQFVNGLVAAAQPPAAALQVLDVKRRIMGTGSLGVERLLVLTEGTAQRMLFDIKEIRASAFSPAAPSAQRVIDHMKATLPQPTVRQAAATLGSLPVVVTQLHSGADKISVDDYERTELPEICLYLGALTGELHRRGTTQTPRWSTAQQQQVFSLATELAAAHEAAFLQFCQATHDTVG